MSNWFTHILSGSTGSLVDSIAEVADRFIQSPDEKASFALQVEQLLQQRDSEIEQTLRAELGAKQQVLVAELQQGDSYTKRARPTLVYAGLLFIFINHVLVPLLGRIAVAIGDSPIDPLLLAPLTLPSDFWYVWGGICSTWVIGRSAEKRGIRTPAVQRITGTPLPTTSLLD